MEDSSYFNAYGASITVSKNDVTRVLYLGYFTKNYDFLEFKNYLLKRLNNVLIKLDSSSLKTDKYKVLLTNEVVTSILSTFVDSFNSKKIYLNESVFTDKFNKKIFSDKINIVEDSRNGIETECFDSEGTIKEFQNIVKDGKFIKEINNLEYALLTKKDITSC